jgi:hypothetical protein
VTNQTLWACPTCLRAASEVRDAVPRCRDAGNGANGRCLYQTQQAAIRAAFTPPSPVSVPAVAPLASPPRGAPERPVPERPVPARVEASSDLEQQLAREKEAHQSLRAQLRMTEAVAAESKALRARMTDEMGRMNAEMARLRAVAAEAGAAAGADPGGGADDPVPAPVAMTMPTPRLVSAPMPFDAAPESSPPPPRTAPRRLPWLALGLLAGLAVGAGGATWLGLPGSGRDALATAFGPAGPASPAPAAPHIPPASHTPHATQASVEANLAAAAAALARAPAPSTALPEAPVPSGAVALAPVSADALLAAQPPAGGGPGRAHRPARGRNALGAEGIAAPVNVDARTGLVAVSDPASDAPTRERTDTIIRAVFAGANLPEPAIEHRWLSTRPRPAAAVAASVPAPQPVPAVAAAKARSGSSRHAASAADDGARPALAQADDEPPPSLPLGRVATACKAALSRLGPVHRKAALGACMKNSCCNPANRRTEECQAYDRSVSLVCSAG